MSLGKTVFSSALLLFLRKVWGNVVNLIVMAFLARVLSTEDFGLLAISSVFLGIINTVATSGISEYVIYYDGDDKPIRVNAAFWLNLVLTVGVILVIILAGPLWAKFYKNEAIYFILLLLCVAFFFEMNSMVPKALLRKELEYKSLVLYSSISMTAVSIGKLGAAWFGFGVYSLALPQAIVSPFLMIAFFVRTGWRPMTGLSTEHFRPIFNYSKQVIGGRVLTKLVNEGDNLIVGKVIGLEGLGIYALAFQLANLVTTNVVFLVNDLFLPLFSKLKNDLAKLSQWYTRTIQFLSFASFPLLTALIVCSKPLILLIYGEKWLEVVLPFQILCLFAMGRSLSSPSSSLFAAIGRPEINFKFSLLFAPVFLVSVFVGSSFGVIGVAISTTVVRIAGSIVSLHLSLQLINLTLRDLYFSVRSNLVSTLMCLSVFLIVVSLFGYRESPILVAIGPIVLYVHYLIQRFFFVDQFWLFLAELDRLSFKGMSLVRKVLFIKRV